jgi:hypothetical protein
MRWIFAADCPGAGLELMLPSAGLAAGMPFVAPPSGPRAQLSQFLRTQRPGYPRLKHSAVGIVGRRLQAGDHLLAVVVHDDAN